MPKRFQKNKAQARARTAAGLLKGVKGRDSEADRIALMMAGAFCFSAAGFSTDEIKGIFDQAHYNMVVEGIRKFDMSKVKNEKEKKDDSK